MTLHLLSTTSKDKIATLQKLLASNDEVVLLGDAVYLTHELNLNCAVYIREKDCQQRGLQTLVNSDQVINDLEWVDLTNKHSNTIHWHD